MLKVTGQAIFSKINAKTLEHPGPCSVLGAGNYPRTGIRGGGGEQICDSDTQPLESIACVKSILRLLWFCFTTLCDWF